MVENKSSVLINLRFFGELAFYRLALSYNKYEINMKSKCFYLSNILTEIYVKRYYI